MKITFFLLCLLACRHYCNKPKPTKIQKAQQHQQKIKYRYIRERRVQK